MRELLSLLREQWAVELDEETRRLALLGELRLQLHGHRSYERLHIEQRLALELVARELHVRVALGTPRSRRLRELHWQRHAALIDRALQEVLEFAGARRAAVRTRDVRLEKYTQVMANGILEIPNEWVNLNHLDSAVELRALQLG